MMQTNKTMNIAGMTCSSCERLIAKAVESEGGKVRTISASSGKAVVDFPEGAFERIKAAIAASGYEVLDSSGRVATAEPFEAELKRFVKRLVNGEKGLETERRILQMSLLSILALVAMGSFLYMVSWRGSPGIDARIPFLFYSAISAVAVTAAVAHYHSHRFQFTCMEGMMTGMTIGMMAGFLFGAVVGATNGMFMGSVFGMAVGMVAGAYCGKCCGIMGLMEGMMAGLMGGTMGAMLTVMMIADNLLLFMPLFVVSCVAILAGLTYMIHHTAGRRSEAQLMPLSNFFFICLLLSTATSAIVILGPRSSITV